MKDVSTVGIVGFGVMGAAIGLNAATAGYRVVFKEMNDELLKGEEQSKQQTAQARSQLIRNGGYV